MYKSSADILIDSIGDNKQKIANEIIIPCIYLYRHSLELILKAILLTHYLMEKDMTREKIQDKLSGHNLDVLWRRTENILHLYFTGIHKS